MALSSQKKKKFFFKYIKIESIYNRSNSMRIGESTYYNYNDNFTEENYSVGITTLKTRC